MIEGEHLNSLQTCHEAWQEASVIKTRLPCTRHITPVDPSGRRALCWIPSFAKSLSLAKTPAKSGKALDTLELDLHGKTWPDALQDFVDAYNKAVQPGGHACRNLRVVHGYGSTGGPGVLRTRFRKFLEKHSCRLEYATGERTDGNPGCTLVTPKFPLPGADAAFSELVWDYCEQPKTLSKIVGQFRRYGNPRVQQAVRSLEGQKRLRRMAKARNSVYQAV